MITQNTNLYSMNPNQIISSTRKKLKASIKGLPREIRAKIGQATKDLNTEVRQMQRQWIAIDPEKIAQKAMSYSLQVKIGSDTTVIPVGLIGMALLKNPPVALNKAKELVVDWTLEQIRQAQRQELVEAEAAKKASMEHVETIEEPTVEVLEDIEEPVEVEEEEDIEEPAIEPELSQNEPVKEEKTKQLKSWWSRFMDFFKMIFSAIGRLFAGKKNK